MSKVQNGDGGSFHPVLLTPEPIEIDPYVSQAMTHVAESHFGTAFCNIFGDVLSMLRKLVQTTDPATQPFVIAGSGTLGWDFAGANFVEPGEAVLIPGAGFFADAFAECLSVYGADVTKLKAPIPSTVTNVGILIFPTKP